MIKKISAICIILLCFFTSKAFSENKFGIELGWAHLPGFEDEVMDTGQSLANLLGTTVTVETDTGALVLRGFYQAELDGPMGYEIGAFISSDVETKYSITGASITMTQDTTGIDAALLYEVTDGIIIKGGFHSSEVDGEATVSLGGQSAAVTANDSGTGILFGIGSENNNSQFNYSLTYYDGLGGSDDSDATLFSVKYSF